MASQYEVEHNVQLAEARRPTRRVDMASFFALLNMLSSPDDGTLDDASAPQQQQQQQQQQRPRNPHATPTPVDTASLFRLLQDQLFALHTTAPTADNRAFLHELVASLDADINNPPATLPGVSQLFLDTLERVPRKTLSRDDDCAICKVPYLDDEWCLVVELPCDGRHRFDLECVGPWLRSKGSCPMCRQEMRHAKGRQSAANADDYDEEDGDADMMYA